VYRWRLLRPRFDYGYASAQRDGLAMTGMICLICRQAELVNGLTSLILERDEIKINVNGVPARICPSCGEAVLDDDVAVRLLDAADEVAALGMSENVLEYEVIA
jgi:YgiT-type zinc finger domain-containing protein